MKPTLHLKSAIIAWIRGPTRCQGLALLFVPVLFACFALSQTTQAVNPAPGSSATSESLGASDGPQNFSNTALLRSAFDVPGAGTGPGQGTQGIHINPTGTIAGYFTDANDVNHGLVRASNGAITTFDAPGAGTGPGQGTRTEAAACINPAGAIVGFYTDASDVLHGYVRVPGGTITTFDAPGAGTGTGQGTDCTAIKPEGE